MSTTLLGNGNGYGRKDMETTGYNNYSEGISNSSSTSAFQRAWNTRICQIGMIVGLSICVILVIVLAIVAARDANSGNTGIAGGVRAVPAFTNSPFWSYPGSPATTPLPIPVNMTIGFIADTAINQDTYNLYTLLKARGAEVILVSGDLDYVDNPDGWDAMITHQMGANYPFLVAAGNHDESVWPDYQAKIIQRWQNADIKTCSGIVGVAHTCTWKGVTIVQITPGVFNASSSKWNNTNGIGNIDFVAYIRESFARYPSKWKICAWHKNQHTMQTGDKKDETGWGVYQECLAQGAMIMTGHEHSYERSYIMTDVQNPNSIDTTDAKHLQINSTHGFVIVQGLGGHDVRYNYNPSPIWAAMANANMSSTYSGNLCQYNFDGQSQQAYCYGIDIKKKIIDEFYITVGE